ncbi:hypothetical protein YPPY103_5044, partial [Yersinia pestis PY-103]
MDSKSSQPILLSIVDRQ